MDTAIGHGLDIARLELRGHFPRGHFFPRRRLPPLQIAFVRERCAFNARRTPTARAGARTRSTYWGLKLSKMHMFGRKCNELKATCMFSIRNTLVRCHKYVFLHKNTLILMPDVR